MTIAPAVRLALASTLAMTLIGVAATAAMAADRASLTTVASGVTATSERVGGYVATGGRRAKAIFVVPAVTCGSQSASTLFGIAGFSAAGSLVGGAGVAATCSSGDASYELASEFFEGQLDLSGLSADVGDVIEVHYQWAPHDGSLEVEVTNRTDGSGFGAGAFDNTGELGTVEIGASRVASSHGAYRDVPKFGRAVVRAAAVDGHALGAPGAQRTTLVDDDGTPLIQPSDLTHRDHRFTLTAE